MISFLVLLIPGESVKTFPKFSSCHRYFSLSRVLDERHASNRFIFLGYVFLFTGDFSVYLAAFSCETMLRHILLILALVRQWDLKESKMTLNVLFTRWKVLE